MPNKSIKTFASLRDHARFFGYSHEHIRAVAEAGQLPKRKGQYAREDLAPLLEAEREITKSNDGLADLRRKIQLARWKLNLERDQWHFEREKGQWIKATEATQTVAHNVARAKVVLLALPVALSPTLAGLGGDVSAIQKTLEGKIREALTLLAGQHGSESETQTGMEESAGAKAESVELASPSSSSTESVGQSD